MRIILIFILLGLLTYFDMSPIVFMWIAIIIAAKLRRGKLIASAIIFLTMNLILRFFIGDVFSEEIGQLVYITLWLSLI